MPMALDFCQRLLHKGPQYKGASRRHARLLGRVHTLGVVEQIIRIVLLLDLTELG